MPCHGWLCVISLTKDILKNANIKLQPKELNEYQQGIEKSMKPKALTNYTPEQKNKTTRKMSSFIVHQWRLYYTFIRSVHAWSPLTTFIGSLPYC